MLNKQKINPCLWFDNQAQEAVNFYTSLFGHSKIGEIAHYGEAGAQASGQKKGSVMTVEFELDGQELLALNGGPYFKFSPAVSFFVHCKSETEVDDFWKNLSKGGSVLMELQKYPWADKYGWCEDRYGISWQIMLSEVKPKVVPSLLFVNKLFGKGEEAIHFYTSVFKDSKVENIHRDQNSNSIMHASFSLNGQKFVLMEGQGEHKHTITPAISFIINCDTQAEVDEYWEKLSADGGEGGQCGWLNDKFGVSWQVTPRIMSQLMSSPAKSESVMKAMLGMKKLDIKKLEQAAAAVD